MKKEKCGLEKSHIYWVYNENTIDAQTIGFRYQWCLHMGSVDKKDTRIKNKNFGLA